MSVNIHLSDRELDTVIDALRLWQRTVGSDKPQDSDIADIGGSGSHDDPLSPEEIDELCERINVGVG